MVDGWTLSQHAIDRALDMAIDGEAIRKVLEEPEGKWDCPDPERELWWHGRVCLAVNIPQKRVVTVLWNTGHSLNREEFDDELFWRD